MDKKYLAISEKYNVKLSCVEIKDSLNKICELQEANPYAIKALGRIIIDTILSSSSIKNADCVNVSYNGRGLMGVIVAEYQDDKIRGYVDYPNFDLGDFDDNKTDLTNDEQATGIYGLIQLSRKKENNKPFVSNVELISGSIDLNFMYYLSKSDQIKTLLCSSVKLDENAKLISARGVCIQILPRYKEENLNYIEEKIGSMIDFEEKIDSWKKPEDFLKTICEDVKILESKNIKFKCTCSMQKAKSSILLLEKEDQKKAIKSGNDLEIICDFCKTKYLIPIDFLKNKKGKE